MWLGKAFRLQENSEPQYLFNISTKLKVYHTRFVMSQPVVSVTRLVVLKPVVKTTWVSYVKTCGEGYPG